MTSTSESAKRRITAKEVLFALKVQRVVPSMYRVMLEVRPTVNLPNIEPASVILLRNYDWGDFSIDSNALVSLHNALRDFESSQ